MKKFLIGGTTSILAIIATTNANAAGYTCEELVQYTSCNPGYFLFNSSCPIGQLYAENVCCLEGSDCYANRSFTENECAQESDSIYYSKGCFLYKPELDETYMSYMGAPSSSSGTSSCDPCPAGNTCSGGISLPSPCYGGQYQPNTGQTSCLTAPAGSYVPDNDVANANYTLCSVGEYQPNEGAWECLKCPAGSYCGETGLTAVSGSCGNGDFSYAGASACLTCPTHEYTNKDGETVTVPAASPAIATGPNACYIDSETYFEDIKGIYRFRENCKYDTSDLYVSINNESECNAIGQNWDDADGNCYINNLNEYLPTKAICEMWRAGITDEDYRDAIVCDENGNHTCGGGMWYLGSDGLQCDW
ncbi:MAG: hypothetical protein IKB10_01890 [Alphaproteobacteria bacterium]|nr:hypothetical protein [Alphaproteobacteria bacterium]